MERDTITSRKSGEAKQFAILKAMISDGAKSYRFSKMVDIGDQDRLPDIQQFDAVTVTNFSRCKIEFGEYDLSGDIAVV